MSGQSFAQHAIRPIGGKTNDGFARSFAQETYAAAHLPHKRRQMISVEETMLHDLYLMSGIPTMEAATRRNDVHRTLTFAEMAASGKRRERTREKRANQPKGFLATLLEGMLRI